MTDDPIAPMLADVAAQDRAAFRQIYSATSAKLMGVLLRILGNRAEAEDALQEVFTRVWLRAARFDAGKGRGMTWLIAIASNHAIDRLRARPAPSVSDDGETVAQLPDGQRGALAGLVAEGEARRAVKCFGELDSDHAAAVKGAYLDGLSYDALAEKFDVPLNTMRTWLRRSLLKLRECLDQ
ncbi:sigma-70 family RNA polymerase sigma factor [Pseudorhodobacter sp.]|uniref:sigma-70 family RNA polymerase sigma factor n=1 Tax=Pseudorhodobacter sp. TaxID=1934400 RepID=UPI002647219D|nr:sigma-70 family RNA polymerase sigma factor [Pseudorhodobacter sp.]MDN5786874.1 sigma-70 family RNA polymerase sigma factor [Pseudorhodobacter sp.]